MGKTGWGNMRGRSRRSSGISTSVMACLAIIGGAGVGGLAAGFNVRAGLAPQASTTVVAAVAEMAPSDKVGLRFPADWAETAAAEPAVPALPAVPKVTLASADPGILCSPQPTYAANDAAAPNMIEAKAPPAVAAPPKVAVASLMPKPKPKPRSNAVLNDSQLASIKRRLNLTPEQERYWPAIEAELRKMEYTKSQGGTRTASIDMSKVNVDGLKSAGFPLVMSFSDDQRRELKSLTHLLGLESVMAGL
jgi:hypothetical protein